MLALIDRLAIDFRTFAPEMVASPKTSMYRIYRDTRFSDDKTPYKIQAAASFRWRGLDKGRGAGLYLEVGPSWTWMGGGFYAPETPDLVRIREHIAETWPEIHTTVRTAAFTRAFGALDGETLTRVPRGYPKDHPAAEYLKHKNFLAGREFPPEFATSAEFYPTLARDVQGLHAAGAIPERRPDVRRVTTQRPGPTPNSQTLGWTLIDSGNRQALHPECLGVGRWDLGVAAVVLEWAYSTKA